MDEVDEDQTNESWASKCGHLKTSVETDEDGDMTLKASKKPKGCDDDFFSLWGTGSIVSGTPSNSEPATRKRNKHDPVPDGAEPKAASKKAKAQKGHGPIGLGVPAPSSDGSSSAGAPNQLSTSWMFGTKLTAKSGRSKTFEHSQDFDATEKAISQVEGLKAHIGNPAQFLSLSYAKAQAVLDKIGARNTDPLQKIYREASQTPDGSHGLELLKRTVSAHRQAQAIVDFVAALHDAEASAATLEDAVAEVRNQGISLPDCVNHLSYARKCKELAKNENWADYFDSLSKENLGKLFGSEDAPELLDFQASSIKTVLSSLLMAEVKVDCKMDGTELSEEDIQKAKDAEIFRLAKTVHLCLQGFCSTVHPLWKDQQVVAQLGDDICRLIKLTDAVMKDKGAKTWAAQEIEELKGLRSALLSNRKGPLYETLTLFPVGIYIQKTVDSLCISFAHDQGLQSELTHLVELVESLNTTFTGDGLVKEKVVGDAKDLDIQIPSQAKLVEIVSKPLG